MAHECPDCGAMCYCHGDIDDCVIETFAYSDPRCTHWKMEDCQQDDPNDFNEPPHVNPPDQL